MSTKKVRAALETKLNSFATANSLKVAWENKGADYTVSHIRATLFPSPTQNPSIGVEHKRYRGLFRMLVMLTDLNNGPSAVETLGESLADWFPRGSSLTSGGLIVNIESTPSVSSIMYEGNFVYVSVELAYRADTY